MNFLSRLISGETPDCSCASAVESLRYAKAIFEIDGNTSEKVISLIKAFPIARDNDRFDISLDIDGTTYPVDLLRREISVAEIIQEHGDDIDNIALTWVANKCPVDGKANLYSLAAFERHLLNEGNIPFLQTIGHISDSKVWIETDEDEAFLHTDSLVLGPDGDDGPLAWSREDILQGRDDNCQTSFPFGRACPLDFYFLTAPKSVVIRTLFDDLFKLSFLGYVCDRFGINGDGSINYEVQGYKLIKEECVPLSGFYIEPNHARQIFEWTYCGGGVSDKLGLLRNVISLESGANARLCTDGKLWAAVRSNYEIYLKKNVQQYIEVKNKVADLVFDYAERFSEYSRQFVGAFQGAAILLLTSLISLFFLNGISTVGIKGFFAWESFTLLLCVSIVVWLWLFVSYRSLKSNFNSAAVLIQRAIENNYSAILVKEEIEESLGEFIRSNRKHVYRQAYCYALTWALAPALLLLVFIVALLATHVAGSGDGLVLAQIRCLDWASIGAFILEG